MAGHSVAADAQCPYAREWNIVAMTPIQHCEASEYGDHPQPYADADDSAQG